MPLRVFLNESEIEVLLRQEPATAPDGGFQALLVRLREKLDRGTGELELSDRDLEQIPRYASRYGQGGWEDRLIDIFGRHLGHGLRGRS